MTVCGFNLVNGVALAWADSDVLRDGAVVRSMKKLVVSPAGAVGIGTGYADMLAKFLGHVTANVAVSASPAWLRSAHLEKRKHAADYEYRYTPNSSYAVVTAERGVVFRERADFEPEEYDAWSSPHVNLRPTNAADVLECARLQLNFVRVENRDATGGELRIAKIGPDRVVQTGVPLIL